MGFVHLRFPFALSALAACYASHTREAPDARLPDGGVDAGVVVRGDAGPPAAEGVHRLAGGNTHTCAVWPDRTVRCWGDNVRGELGDGTTTTRSTPEPVSGLRDVVDLSAGVSHTCAVSIDGAVRCWGWDEGGALGDGEASPEPATVPVVVAGIDDAVQVSAGAYHTCALARDETVRCWGTNRSGELGDGTMELRASPVQVPDLDGVAEVAAGMDFTCARMTDGTVRCWGSTLHRVGSDGLPVIAFAPETIAGLGGVVELDAGWSHVCARLTDLTVRCWGWNTNGELGDGSRVHRAEPTPVLDLTDALQIDAGGATCALVRGGGVRCWGAWDGAFPFRFEVGVSGAAEIGVGGQHACARLEDGSFRCWGYNSDGQTMAGGCCHESICGIPEGGSCGPHGTCADLWCSGCGAEGEACCDRARHGGRCRTSSLRCVSEACLACGEIGEICCDGETCASAGATCFGGTCRIPGEPGGPCLEGDVCRGGCCVTADHSTRVCVGTGAVCPGSDGTRTCTSAASCSGCGGAGEPCCPSESSRVPFYCTAPGLSCGALTTCTTG